MNKKEFIEMCKSDAGDDINLKACVEVFEEVIPYDADVDASKNPKGFYDALFDYASKNKTNSSYCITPGQAKKLALEYLNLKKVKTVESVKEINLEDFF